MRVQLDMRVRDNWYNLPKVSKALSEEHNCEIIDFKLSSSKSEILKLRNFYFNGSKNFLPMHGYACLETSGLDHKTIETVCLNNSIKEIAAIFLPILSVTDLCAFSQKLKPFEFKERLVSYEIDLKHDLKQIRNRISSRRRSKLEGTSTESIRFFIDRKEDKKNFFAAYSQNMESWKVSKNLRYSKRFFERIFSLEETLIFSAVDMDGNVLSHCLGFNRKKTHAEFVFSANNGFAKHLATSLIWFEIKWLHQNGFESFHLGGGIKKNDGLSDFKRQFGGYELFNGGVAIVPNGSLFKQACCISKNYQENEYFFPPYAKPFLT